jgi:phosphoglycolate phosphatase-like HAD superfamily hydrolase
MRILLWDIDGTLMRSVRTGAYKIYTLPVLEEIFGTAGKLADMRVSGMTDLQIVFEALADAGVSQEEIVSRIDLLTRRLTEEARRVTGNGVQFFQLLPGVRETLEVLHGHPRYRSALLTGNIKPMAELKMELMGLQEYFTLPGSFGEESHIRRDLPALAAARIRNYLRVDLHPEHFIVIGDTPNDIDCGRHFGARTVAVGTGRFYSHEEILDSQPDAVLPDLSDPCAVIATLDKL